MRALWLTTLFVSACVRLGVVPHADSAGDRGVGALDGKNDSVNDDRAKPDGRRTDGRGTDASKTDAPRSDVAKPDTAKPDTAKPDTAKPDTAKPDTAKSGDGGVPGIWVSIAKGTFTMGSPTSEPCRSGDESQHQVTLTHGFELLSTKVTQGQFLTVMGYNPSLNTACGSSCPVDNVSWHEAAAYCNALSARSGHTTCYQCSGSGAAVLCQEAAMASGQSVFACPGYRLPIEAEWEYAYRAGTTTALYNGGVTANCSACTSVDPNADKIAWYCSNANSTQPVKGKQPNAWGIYDMAGNVREWVHDWYQSSLGTQPVIDPWGAATGLTRVVRTGSYTQPLGHMRAARRSDIDPLTRSGSSGFRCARSL